jgi:Ca-activated chloride channel family protein
MRGFFMAMMFQCAQPWWLLYGAITVALAIFLRYFWYQPTVYVYPLTQFIKDQKLSSSTLPTKFFFWIRVAILSLMVFLLGKPQYVDSKSKINVEGIDIVLALDMSGSMCCMDDLDDKRSRLQVAKQEALNFIEQRTNDAIGLVLFGRYALVRCPLTLDKTVLKEIISDLELGKPSEDMQKDTMLSQGLITAVRRLQNSKAKSKIVLLLTDGAPSTGDLNPKDAIQVAKDVGVKVYTIGIGGTQGGFVQDPIFGLQQISSPLNKQLLERIAKETGGQFFEAQKPKDLKRIYQIIDSLEKQSYQTELYAKYHDYFMPFLWIIACLILFELFMATWIWFIV